MLQLCMKGGSDSTARYYIEVARILYKLSEEINSRELDLLALISLVVV